MGRMIGSSKSIYRYDNPDHLVVFNANLCTGKNKIWHGDLDLTLDYNKIQKLSNILKTKLYVLYEMDARFENEKKPLLNKAILICDGDRLELRSTEYYYLDKNGAPKQKTDEECKKTDLTETTEKYNYNKEEFEAIELPDTKTFKIKKSQSPLEVFQEFFIGKYGKEKAQEIYPKLYVTPKYMESLEKLVEKFAKKNYPGLHPVKLDRKSVV